MPSEHRKWPVVAIASIYLAVCAPCCLYYLEQFFRSNGATVPVMPQITCLGMAVSAAMYFFRPQTGHRALIIMTIVTLIAIGASDPKASFFHFCVLLILLLPLARRLLRQEPDCASSQKRGMRAELL